MRRNNPRDKSRLNNVRQGSRRYLQNLDQYNDYYGETQTYLRNNENERIKYNNRNVREQNVFQTYDNAPTLDSEKGWLQKTGEFIGSIGSDIANSGRVWTKKFIEQFIDEDYAQIRDLEQEQEDLQKIEEYKELCSRLQDLKQHPQFDDNGWRIDAQRVQSEINQLESKKKEYDNYFMGEGRSHTVIAQQMFDINKMDALDKLYVNAKYIDRDRDRNLYLDGSIGGVFKQIGTGISNIFSEAGNIVDWVYQTGSQAIKNLYDPKKANGYKTGEVIKTLNYTDKGDRAFLEKLYKGSEFNKADISTSINDEEIGGWKEYNNRKINELSVDLKNHQTFAKDGKLFGIDIYDPEDIPQQFKDAQEKFGKVWYDYVIHPYDALLYSIPETASTVGLFGHQLKAMGVNGMLGYLAKNAPVWAIKSKGTLLEKPLSTIGKIAGGPIGKITAVTTGLDAAVKSRKQETSLEAIQGISERVSKIVQERGGDFQRIINSVEKRASYMGIDTSDFQIDDFIKFAIAYNINTGDKVFDNAKVEARRGINKLINSNNALAVIDYLQALPFMSYSGSAFKGWAANLFEKSAGKYGPYMPGLNVVEKSKPVMQAVSDATIGKVANKFIKDGSVKTGLYLKHAGEWALNKTPLIVGESFSEGLEEINQEILQSRYKRGLYDDYNNDVNMLDIHEVFGNVNMSFEGLAAYLGIHPQDPELSTEDIRRAFHIGAATSALFAGALRATSNFGNTNNPNVRNLIAQLKNDKYISNIVANYYNQVQDQEHLELFFDAFTKAGINRSRLTKSLVDLRDAVDEQNTLVRKDFVNSDIQLMNAAWAIFNNPYINEALKPNGIEKYSDEHKQLVIDGATAIVEDQKNEEKIKEGSSKVKKIQDNHINIVREMLDEATSEDRLKQIQEEYPELANIVVGLRNDYLDYKNNRDAVNRGKFGAFSRKFDTVEKFSNNEGVRDYISRNGLSQQVVEKENEEGYDPLREEAHRIFINPNERKKALRHAFNYENRKKYNDLLQQDSYFYNNKYIRQYARKNILLESELDEKLRELYNDKNKRQQAIDFAYESFNNGTYSLDDYVTERIHLLHLHQRLQRLKYARDVAADKHRRNQEIRKYSGLDTYTGLEGIIKSLDKEIEHYEKIEYNQLNKKGTPQDQKLTWEMLFKDKDYKFDDQQEFDQEFSTLMLNRAINGPQKILAAAYMRGYANPISLKNALFGFDDESNDLTDIVAQYNSILAEEKEEINQDSEATSLTKKASKTADKQALSKKAAWTIIKKRLDEKLKRRRIANRIFEEEGPITPAIEEHKQEQQVEEQQQAQEEQENKKSRIATSQEAPLSDSEKRLNEKYNHTRGEQKTLSERIEEQRERRKKAVVKDHYEDAEEEISDDALIEDDDQADGIDENINSGTEEEPIGEEISVGTEEKSEQTTEEPEKKSGKEPKETVEEEPTEDQVEEDDEEEQEQEIQEQPSDDINFDETEDQNQDEDELFDLNEGEEEFVVEEDEDAEQSAIDAEQAALEFEEQAELNAKVLEEGWIFINDYSKLEFNEEGFLTYEGEVLSEEQQNDIIDDLILLGLTESVDFNQDELPDGTSNFGQNDKLTKSNDKLVDLVSQTFFYQPNPEIDQETGEDVVPKLTIDGKQVDLGKPLASGRKLSENLSKLGWLASTKKYFIVTQSEQGKKVAKDKDPRDAMTIALIIEDDSNCYATFLRPLGLTESEGFGKHGSDFVNSETKLRNWLSSRHVDWRKVLESLNDNRYSINENGQIVKQNQKYPLTSSEKVKLYKQAVANIAMERGRQQYYANNGTYDGFEYWWSNDPIRSNYKDDESWQKALSERKRIRKLFTERARQSLAHAGKQILSDEQIEIQITNLRNYRNSIIDAYLTKKTVKDKITYTFPKTVKKTVTPIKVEQSNGRINNKKDKFYNPVYRTICDPNSTIEEVEQSLSSGEITLGYGLGMYAGANDRFSIRGLLDDYATIIFNGKGLSGKIYMMVDGPAGADTKIPIMLAEEKFNTQVQIVNGKQKTIWLNNPNNLKLCLKKNPVTGKFENVNTEGYQPSAAEIIFYMLIDQIGVGLDAERHAEMVEFFIHSGEKTLLKNQPKTGNDPFNFLASKQLAWHTVDNQQVLTIGINQGDGSYIAKSYTSDQLMEQSETGEDLRRQIISAIATQMHWNTDISHMNSSINILGTSNSSVAQLFRWAIDNFAKDYENVDDYLNQRVSIFGCPQLSFRIGDFFTKDGDDIKQKENVSILAWMIKEGKIKTDTEKNPFIAPFVFANGVQVEGGSLEQEVSKVAEAATGDQNQQIINVTEEKPKQKPKKKETVVAFNLFDQQIYDEMVSDWRPGLEERRKREGWYVAKTEEERQQVIDSINETKAAKDNGGINDRIMIRAPKSKISKQNAVKEFKNTVKEFLDKYNKQYPDRAVNDSEISINSLTEELIKDQWALKRGYAILDLYKNGKAKVQIRRDSDFSNWQNPVTGVFSNKIGGSGTFDFDKARKWLSETLGIDEDNIVLTKAIMRSMTNDDVFGLTNVALDRIAGEVTGYMKFSEYADSGIEYHEAWHYVNLLIHDKETRNRIYKSYLKNHKNLNKPGVKIKDIEEAMADDFKLYMEGFFDKSTAGKIRRLFRNILDFLIVSRRKSEYRIAYKAIANGEYSSSKLDKESVREFQNRYKQGVFSVQHNIPGLSKKELDAMTNVQSYQDIFDGTNAVLNRVFSTLDLTSPKKMKSVASDGFDKILQIVDEMIDEQSDDNIVLKLQDIRNNERFLKKALIDAFLELGIVAKVKKSSDITKTERNEINEDALKKEDSPDNTWDKFTLTSQRKENASLSTKMFLRLIPIYTKQYLEDGTVEYIPERDKYGTIKMYDPDQAWRNIIDVLWGCDSYSETDESGNYSPTSLMGIVETYKNISPFFYSLYLKLQDIDLSGEYGDTQLKSQIFSTINSSKTQVQVIKIQNPIKKLTFSEEDLGFGLSEDELNSFDDNGVVADKRRQWIIQNDSLVSTARNTPRKWSKNLASNGLLGFNESKKESVVDKNFAKKIEKDLESIQKILLKYTTIKKKGFVPKSTEQVQKVLDDIKPKIIKFYTDLGIESDMPSLNVYIALMSGINGELTPQEQIDTLSKIFNTSKVGSISYIIEGIVENIGNNQVTHSGSKYERAIDEAFSEYAADSDIGVLALAWSAIHPSSQEFSVKDANNNRLYPINLNNYVSDRVRAMNNRRSGYIKRMQRSSYCKHSIICDAANSVDTKDPKTKIKLNTFVGIRDANNAIGADYFGITATEDYISKLLMTEQDQIIFPTMADKPTWNSLSSSNISLTHDTMLISPLSRDIDKYIYQEYESINPYDKTKYTSKYAWNSEARKWYRGLNDDDDIKRNIIKNASFDLGSKRKASIGFDLDVDAGHVEPRFQDTTLNRFALYFLDELNSLIDYYDKKTVASIVSNKNNRIENFHGKVENGRMDFSGNGGKFRYLYDIPLPGIKYNLNQTLQGLFELQKKIESGKVIDKSRQEGDIKKYVGASVLNSKDTDGFELIREYLSDLKKTYFKRGGIAKPELLNAINKKLVSQTEQELFRISRPGSPLQIVEFKNGQYIPKGIPEQLLNRYTKVLQEAGYGSFGDAYDSEDLLPHALFSLIGSHVANTATSIIEVEKIFSGDPAFYKKKAKSSTEKIIIEKTFDTGEIASEEVEVEILDDVFSDKIKRLGGLLSPGQELRLDFSEEELQFDPTLKCSKYTNLNVEDIKIPSLFLDEIEYEFKRSLLIDLIRNDNPKGFSTFFTQLQNEQKKTNERLKKEGKKQKGELTVENVIDKIDNDKKLFDKMWSLLTNSERRDIEDKLEQQMYPYRNITVADAQVFIRPDLYRKIRIALGQWSFEPDETGYSDEEAYNILEGITIDEDGNRIKSENPSDDWAKDPKLYAKVRKLSLFPLKMSYFQNDTHQITENISINKPIYNKMAIFPLFAFQRSTSVGAALYKRMNKKGNELDMISFKSAVKVGAVQKGADVISKKSSVQEAMSVLNEQIKNDSDKHLDYTTGEIISGKKSKNSLAVTVQDLRNLRMQLNTQAHESDIRAIGTQMFKIAFSNIIDDAFYGTGKSGRKARRGSNIKKDIISCINALTRMGIDDIKDRFYKDGHINNSAVQQFVETVVKNNGLGSSAEEIIANGGVAAGIISRTVFENSASAVVNSDVVDINTKGGAAIQQSVFGFVGYGNDNIGTLCYNGGKELKWSASEGSMQVLLSMNFFKSVIPNYNNLTHDQRKEWLIKHNVIGENSKPFGVGYRIPTQGMSSMFAFQVADVLPEQVADLIIVPREFTAQTGSDFDVDKLYLATMSYKDGVLESISNEAFSNKGRSFEESLDVAEDRQLAQGVDTDEIDVYKLLTEANDITKEVIRGAIANRLLLNYIDIISDKRNYSDARGSIDVITNTLHDKLLDPVLKTKTKGYIEGMYELLPSFQALRKMEFGVGKSGIAPFALNITNLALTQYTHLTINFGQIGEEYGFRPLDQIYGKDGNRISSWLSAMVNAHVDVAKDPYVFDLNVNQATYNHANLLLRAGMGITTFTFLAQPSIKNYADTLNNVGGLYGDNIEGDTPISQANNFRKKRIYNSKIKYYRSILENIVKNYKDDISDGTLERANKTIEYYEYLLMSRKERKDSGYTDENQPQRVLERKDMFSEDLGKRAILNFKIGADLNKDNVNETIDSIIYQLFALESFNELNTFAQQLSELVQCSQIDTKKFGNTIHDHINFINKYDAFELNSTLFTINDPDFIKSLTPKDEKKGLTQNEISQAALHQYFNSLYLDLKLKAAVFYTKDILSRQLFSATSCYESLFKNILGIINGFDIRTNIDGSQNIGYNTVYNKKSIDSFAEGIDNMMRFNSLMAFGPDIYKNAITKHGSTNMIDFTIGGDMNSVINKFKELTIGANKNDSIFKRLAKFINDIKKNPYEEFADGLVDSEGNIINDLLLYLNPQTPNDKYPIGRMLLRNSQTENKSSEERRLISAFAQLLEHKDENVRALARDLAFYAYFSTYDQNTASSFFHLVPYEYRKQYDLSLRSSLNMLNSRKKSVRDDAIKNIGGGLPSSNIEDAEMQAASNMLDVLSRNYWFDDNIVPVHYTTNSPAEDKFQSTPRKDNNYQNEEFVGAQIYDADSGRSFPTYIATTRVKNNSVYIKIRKGSGTFLYKRVGVVNRTYLDKEGNQKKANSYSIYIAIPKAGLHTKGISQFELYANYFTPSIFSQNKLEKDYAEDVVRKEIEEIVNDSNGSYYNLEIVWDNDQIPDAYMSSNTSVYFDDTPTNQNKKRISGITVYSKNKPEYVGQKTATVIFDIVDTPTSGDVSRPNVLKEYSDKVVEVPLNGDIESVVKRIKELNVDNLNIHLTTPIYDGKFEISDELFENYIKEELDKYNRQLDSNIEDKESLLKAKEESLRNGKYTRRNIAQNIINDKLHDLTQQLILSGITINRYSAAAFEGKTQLSVSIAYLKHIFDTYLNSDKNTIFVHKELSNKKKKFRSLLAQLDYTPSVPTEQEEDQDLKIKEEELETSETKVEAIVEKEQKPQSVRSKFAIGQSEMPDESEQDTGVENDVYDDSGFTDEAMETCKKP